MDIPDLIGMKLTVEKVVTRSMTASHVGSGGVDVLATPILILLFEQTARDSVQDALPEGITSVGVKVDIEHVSATPIGELVAVSSEVISVEGNLITYLVEANDEHSRIGGGTHRRYIITLKRFMERLAFRNRS